MRDPLTSNYFELNYVWLEIKYIEGEKVFLNKNKAWCFNIRAHKTNIPWFKSLFVQILLQNIF